MKELYDIYDTIIADSYKFIFTSLSEIHKAHPYSKERTVVVDCANLNEQSYYAYHVLIDACGLLGWQVKVKAASNELQELRQTKKFLKKIKRTNLPKNLGISQIVNKANELLQDNGLTINCGEIYKAYWEDCK